MITQLYKDSDSDTYGRRGRQYRSRSLGFVPPPLGGAFGGVSGNPPAGGASCAPCPTGCRTETRKLVYYARPTRSSPSDVAIKVARKIVKCEDVSGVPKIACDQSGLNGLSGCNSCSGNYSNRM
ncbi:MAG: hypothetical protein U0264_05220 [Candidatus Kapaibacterium sp.]